MSSVWSRRGGEPDGRGISGLVLVSFRASRCSDGVGSVSVCSCAAGGGEVSPPPSVVVVATGH